MNLVSARQLSYRTGPLDRLQSHLGLEVGRKSRFVLGTIRLLSVGTNPLLAASPVFGEYYTHPGLARGPRVTNLPHQ